MPGAGNRYVPFRFSYSDGRGEWGVEDLADGSMVSESTKGHRKRPWRGDESSARHMASVLSKGGAKANETSLSQVIHWTHVRNKRKGQTVSAFRRCTCGVMYRGEVHCAAP